MTATPPPPEAPDADTEEPKGPPPADAPPSEPGTEPWIDGP